MTAQEVIKKFMAALNTQDYTLATDALNEAVKSSSRYSSIQDLIDNFLADQKTAERYAIKTILGNDGNYKDEYEGKQLSELLEMATTDTELAAALNNSTMYSDDTINYANKEFTATKRIRMLMADTFLQDYCGILLERYVYLDEEGDATYSPAVNIKNNATGTVTRKELTTGNVDTGAITGSDAGGDTVKDSDTIVQEIGNKYTAKTTAPQIINTGTNDWIVSATAAGDTIYSGGADSIDAAGGADVIYVEGNASTIKTGEGDNYADFVNVGANVKTVSIVDFDEFDTLKIEGDFILASASLNSNDAVTVTDVTGKRIFIINGWSTSKNSTVLVNGKTFTFGNWLSSFIDYTPSFSGNSAETETSTASAISVNLSDVTSIGGSFSLSGNSSTYNASVSSGAVGEVSTEFPDITTFTTHGLTVELWGESTNSDPTKLGGLTTLTLDTMSTAQKTIFSGLYKWWVKESLKLNEESYDLGFTTDGVTGTNIKVFFYTDKSSNTLAFVRNYGSGKDLELAINMADYSSILEDNENGSTTITDSDGNSTTSYLDRTIAHEINHAILAANFNNFNSLPLFITEGLAELVHGIDDTRTTRIWSLASGETGTLTDGSTIDRLAYALNLDTTSSSGGDAYAGGYMLLRYFAKQAAAQTATLPALGDVTVRVSLTGANTDYYSNLTSTSIERATTTATSSNYLVGRAENYNYDFSPGIRQQIYTTNDAWAFSAITSNNTLVAGSGNDSATIGGEYNKISLGGGNDYVEIYGNNNTITSGDGKDTISISTDTQSVTVTDFDVANDLIYLSSNVNSIGYSSNSIILNDTTIYLDNAENISDFFDMNIRAGRYTRTFGNMLGVKTFDWSNGTYYFTAENDTVNLADGVTAFSNVPASAYAKITIRNKNINLDFSEGCTISITPPDSNSHTFTIGDYSCTFTGAATIIGAHASSGNFTVSGDFYFYDNGVAKTMTYSGRNNVAVSLGDTLKISGLTSGAAFSITDGTNTEVYTASGNYIIKEIATETLSNGVKISEEVYTYQGAYTSGNILGVDFSTPINHYFSDYQNLTVTLLSGTFELASHTFKIISANEDGVTFNYDSDGANLVGISNFDEGESISIDGTTYTVSGGKITRSDEKIYSGDTGEFISNLSNSDYWQILTNFNDTVISAEKNITGTDTAESFSVENVTVASGGVLNVNAAGGNDSISAKNLSVSGDIILGGGADNDSLAVSNITIGGGNVYVQGENGSDTISAENIVVTGSNLEISGGNGADLISVKNTTGNGKASIYGDADSDLISVTDSSGVQISGGSGTDTLTFGGTVTATIGDFSADDIISLGSAVSSGKFESGVLTLGNVNLNLSGVNDISNYENVQIYNGTTKTTLGDLLTVKWTVSNGVATYGENLITVSGLSSSATADDIILDGTTVKISAHALNQNNTVKISDGYTLALAEDVTTPDTESATWTVTRGTANYISGSTTAGYVVSNNQIVYQSAGSGESLITITGLNTAATTADISLDETTKTVTIAAHGLSTGNTVKITDGYTLALADDVTTPETGSATWSVRNGTANYISGSTTAGYVVSNNQIVYQSAGSGEALITITGLNTAATVNDISFDETTKTVTIAAHGLSTGNTVKITDGYTLALADDVTTPETGSATWSVRNGTANYISGSSSAGYVILNNQIIYQSTGSGESLITITGLNTAATVNDISFDETTKTVTIAAHGLSTGNTVTITDGYTLALAEDVTTPETGSATWSVRNGTANYISGSSSAGYVILNNQIIYQSTGSGEALITITGLGTAATTADISLNDTTVTIAAHALSINNTVKITDGYTLALAEDVTTPEIQDSTWSVSRGTANYTVGATTAGYVISDNQIVYQKAGSGENEITVTGLGTAATVDDISLKGTTVTIAAHALNQNNTVTINDGYTLELAEDVTIPVTSYMSWTVSRGTASYIAGSSTAGYVVSNNQIVYQNAGSGEPVITITGLNAAATLDDISFNSRTNTVTIAAHALNKNNTVTITDGYTLKLGSDVETSTETAEGWQVSNGTAKYQTATQSAGYILADNKITYTAATTAKTLVTVTGLKSTAKANQLSLNGQTVTVAQAATTKGELKISTGYALTLAKGTYSGVSVIGGSGVDTITQNGGSAVISVGAGNDLITLGGSTSKNTIDAGAGNDIISIGGSSSSNVIIGGAGNDSVTVTKGKNIYQYTPGDGNDTISGWTANDTLKITSGNISSWSVKDSDLTLKIGSGAITILDGAGMSINVLDKTSTKATTYIFGNNLKYNAKKTAVSLASSYSGTYNETVSSVVTIDGSAATSAISITGNTSKNSISGGSKNDTLNGGKGNDTLIGGDGDDVFIFNKSEGNDVITDYTAGHDKISIGTAVSTISVKNSDVIFKAGSNTLTVKNGKGQKITLNDETYIYDTGKIYNNYKTAVTLTAATNVTLENGVLTADGSTLTGKQKIIGNSGNNTIYGGTGADSLNGAAGNDLLSGGKGNDTLNGGAGNDTFTGGDGNDVFIYEGGNDVITDYTAGKDKLKISDNITGVSVSGSNVIFRTAGGSATVVDGVGQKITTLNSSSRSTVQIYYKGYTFNEKQTAVTIDSKYSGTYNETVSSVVTIDGSAATSAISITGNTSKNSISGGTKNDTLNGGKGNDTLIGGSGNDVFIFTKNEGNDVITDYTAGQDKISIGADIASISVKNSDVVFKVGNNTLTVKKGKGEKITVNDETYIYDTGKIYNEKKTAVTFTAAFSGNLEEGILTADGSNLTGKLKVTANSSNNTIYGGKGADSLNGAAGNDLLYGGNGADTLHGGAGNDTLTGGDGNDVFVFESGNDLITDYKAGADKIKFTAEISDWSISGSNVIFETAGGKITVENGAGKQITVVDYKNRSTKQTYSATNSQTLDLFEDNNFISDEPQISEITEITADNYSAGKIDTENYLELAQDKNILAYSKEK